MKEKTVKIEILKNGLLMVERIDGQDREAYQILLNDVSSKRDLSDLDIFLEGLEQIDSLGWGKTFCG